jgi:hypothetical protein
MTKLCSHCGKWADGEAEMGMHVAHFCRAAPSGAVTQARGEIKIPIGASRYKVPMVDPAYGGGWGRSRG